MAAPIKLNIIDNEDIDVLSALLQDATVLVGDMGYDQDDQQFLMVAARYDRQSSTPRRRLMGINFSHVTSLKRKGFSPSATDDVLNILAIQNEGTFLKVIFSGKAEIKLECQKIQAHAVDLKEGWVTSFTPTHQTSRTTS